MLLLASMCVAFWLCTSTPTSTAMFMKFTWSNQGHLDHHPQNVHVSAFVCMHLSYLCLCVQTMRECCVCSRRVWTSVLLSTTCQGVHPPMPSAVMMPAAAPARQPTYRWGGGTERGGGSRGGGGGYPSSEVEEAGVGGGILLG